MELLDYLEHPLEWAEKWPYANAEDVCMLGHKSKSNYIFVSTKLWGGPKISCLVVSVPGGTQLIK